MAQTLYGTRRNAKQRNKEKKCMELPLDGERGEEEAGEWIDLKNEWNEWGECVMAIFIDEGFDYFNFNLFGEKKMMWLLGW